MEAITSMAASELTAYLLTPSDRREAVRVFFGQRPTVATAQSFPLWFLNYDLATHMLALNLRMTAIRLQDVVAKRET
jgi:hypothetical protein